MAIHLAMISYHELVFLRQVVEALLVETVLVLVVEPLLYESLLMSGQDPVWQLVLHLSNDLVLNSITLNV